MYLFFFLIAYILLVVVMRSFLFWKKTGINPITFTNKDDAHGYNGKVMFIILVLELIVIPIYSFKINWYEYLLPFWYLENEVSQRIGWSLLILSLVLVWVSQSQMGKSWRIGIDEENKSELVTKGLYAMSRNPIFLGIMIANIGLFIVIPSAFTLLIVCLSTISINTQIRLEEAFLKSSFGKDYAAYSNKVRRWI